MGLFSFTRICQRVFYTEVTRIEEDSGNKNEAGIYAGESFFMASPLKALADYVYVHKLDWDSARPIIESLRVDERSLASIDAKTFDRLLANYSSRRLQRFLEGLRKDLPQ